MVSFARGRWSAALCIAGAFGILSSCKDSQASEWQLRFQDALVGQRARYVEARILLGGCQGSELVYRSEFAIDAAGSVPPALPAGRYGFAARARDEDCQWIAEGCVELDVPAERRTEIVLATLPAQDACGSVSCTSPRCAASSPAGLDCSTRPVQGPVVEVATGEEHSCARLESGWVYCWGRNSEGQLGVDTGGAAASGALQVPGLCDASRLELGHHYSCALRSDGQVWCWGDNSKGQLGRMTNAPAPNALPAAVSGLGRVLTLGAGADHACAVKEDGSIACWGDNTRGQLGVAGSFGPTPVVVPGIQAAQEVAAGGLHSCARLLEQSYCWGNNDDGQLGSGAAGGGAEPRPIASSVVFASIEAGEAHSCGIDAGGRAYCWGKGDQNRLGVGSTESRALPTALAGEIRFRSIAPGDVSTCALSTASELYCWGNNGQGQLGFGDLTSRPTPTRVGGLSLLTSVDVALRHACAAGPGGTYCWGRNGKGETGRGGTSAYETRPAQVVGLP